MAIQHHGPGGRVPTLKVESGTDGGEEEGAAGAPDTEPESGAPPPEQPGAPDTPR